MAKPILIIIGSTATGKSKLAIQLAKRFNGEIINADSMQLYKGLDIVSNKVTQDEQNQIKHHLLSILDPKDMFTVTDFKIKATKIIDDLHKENKLPIIVGGTYYYIECLLYDSLIITKKTLNDSLTLKNEIILKKKYSLKELENVDEFFKNKISSFSFDDVDSSLLHDILKKVDPKAAEILHPKDKRKIIRALQVYQETNKKYSMHLEDQHKKSGGSSKISGPLKYKNSLIIHLNADKNILNERIENRVNEMKKNGLIEELTDFYFKHKYLEKTPINYYTFNKGIFQIIGIKEFRLYFDHLENKEQNSSFHENDNKNNNIETDEDFLSQNIIAKSKNDVNEYNNIFSNYKNDSIDFKNDLIDIRKDSIETDSITTGITKVKKKKNNEVLSKENLEKKLIEKGLNNLKTVTKKYSKNQKDWYLNRFLGNMNRRETPLIFNLDVNNLDKWDENVLNPSIEIVKNILIESNKLPDHLDKFKALGIDKKLNEKKLKFCKYCNLNVVDSLSWEIHIKSKKHKTLRNLNFKNQIYNYLDYRLITISIAVLALIIGYKRLI